jgi:hypothetical protein
MSPDVSQPWTLNSAALVGILLRPLQLALRDQEEVLSRSPVARRPPSPPPWPEDDPVGVWEFPPESSPRISAPASQPLAGTAEPGAPIAPTASADPGRPRLVPTQVRVRRADDDVSARPRDQANRWRFRPGPPSADVALPDPLAAPSAPGSEGKALNAMDPGSQDFAPGRGWTTPRRPADLGTAQSPATPPDLPPGPSVVSSPPPAPVPSIGAEALAMPCAESSGPQGQALDARDPASRGLAPGWGQTTPSPPADQGTVPQLAASPWPASEASPSAEEGVRWWRVPRLSPSSPWPAPTLWGAGGGRPEAFGAWREASSPDGTDPCHPGTTSGLEHWPTMASPSQGPRSQPAPLAPPDVSPWVRPAGAPDQPSRDPLDPVLLEAALMRLLLASAQRHGVELDP